MRYVIINRDTGDVVGKENGYKTKGAALNAKFHSLPHIEAHEYVRNVLKCQPGDEYWNNLLQYIEDHFEVIEINRIFLQGSDGRIYTKEV